METWPFTADLWLFAYEKLSVSINGVSPKCLVYRGNSYKNGWFGVPLWLRKPPFTQKLPKGNHHPQKTRLPIASRIDVEAISIHSFQDVKSGEEVLWEIPGDGQCQCSKHFNIVITVTITMYYCNIIKLLRSVYCYLSWSLLSLCSLWLLWFLSVFWLLFITNFTIVHLYWHYHHHYVYLHHYRYIMIILIIIKHSHYYHFYYFLLLWWLPL